MKTDQVELPEGAKASAAAAVAPLDRIKAGQTVRIRELCAQPDTLCRLREIGLAEGQVIRLIASHSNIICQVCNARFALSQALARMIMVEAFAG